MGIGHGALSTGHWAGLMPPQEIRSLHCAYQRQRRRKSKEEEEEEEQMVWEDGSGEGLRPAR